jgi:uncharacterized integral membrane protein
MKLWRFIVFIIIFTVLLLFIIFNLGNTSDISFGFKVLKDIPVFLTVFSSFMVGLLFAFPLTFGFRSRKKEKTDGKGLLNKAASKQGKDKDSGEKPDSSPLIDRSHYGID